MRYVYLILTLVLFTISWNFDWFLYGQTAIEAVKQVKTGYDYQEGITMVKFWTRMKSIVDVASIVFFILFILTFFKKKTKENENKRK